MLLKSILQTKRHISEVHLCGFFLEITSLESLENILKKFGKKLKKVTISRCIIDYKKFKSLLQLVENVEEFTLTRSRIKLHRQKEEEQEFTVEMKNMKKLDLSGTVFFSSGQNKEKFTVYEVPRFVGKCPILKSLSGDITLLKHFPFNENKLVNLQMERGTPNLMRIGDVVEAQYNLTSLDLMTCFIMDEVLNRIKKCLNVLEVLKINLSGLTSGCFLSLSTLNLKELHFYSKVKWIFNSEVNFLNCKLFETLEVLHAQVDELLISPEAFSLMFTSLKQLKTIHIKTNSVNIIDTIFSSPLKNTLISCTVEFSNIHLIKTCPQFSPTFVSSDNLIFKQIDSLNELKIININNRLASKVNYYFLKYFPNIKKLTMNGFTIRSNDIIWILLQLPKLEHLELKDVNNGETDLFFNDAIFWKINKMVEKAGGHMKVMIITCKEIKLTSNLTSSHFPIVEPQKSEIVLRHR